MTTAEKILQIRGLTVELGTHPRRSLLSDVSFDLMTDQVVGIIGESGSGKTVLSRALVNWIPAPLRVTAGSILYHGRDIITLPDDEMRHLRGRKIAYIGSNPGSALDPTLSIGSQIVEKLLAVEPGLSYAEARNRVLAVLDAVRMPSHRRRFDDLPFHFSGGMMQRVMIVDALVTSPALLVADNITQPLDVTITAQIIRLLRELQRDFNTAIVFVSSALGVVHDIADTVLVLAEGRVVEQQLVDELIGAPRHEYTRRLIADIPRIWGATRPLATKTAEGRADIVLSVRDVTKTYSVRDRGSLFAKRDVQAVRGVSFDLRRGESLGLIGESGCGKSTLSRLLGRLETPDRGQILFKGEDIAHMSRAKLLTLRRGFQLLLQDPFNAIPPHLSIGRTIAEPLLVQGGLSRREVEERVRAVMAEIGISDDLRDQLPVGLSAGQRQRVNIARAMVLDPELLILDETLSALDQVEQGKLLNLFEQLQTRRGITLLYISHDLSLVRRTCDRIGVMYLGRIVELASNDRTFFDPAHPYTRALLSAMPIIEERPYQSAIYLLEGEPPDPIDIPRGCSFRTRCPFAFEACALSSPLLHPRNAHDSVACHLTDPRIAAGRVLPQIFDRD